MKNKTTIKEHHIKSLKAILLPIIFSLISLGIGFLISFWGTGQSFVENSLITALVTLFGFGLTSTIFLYQALKGSDDDKTKKLIHAIVNSLLLTLALIGCAILFDFLSSLKLSNICDLLFNTVRYGALIYASICQVDILIAFVKIIKWHNAKHDNFK